MWKPKPRSHRIIKIAKIVQSIDDSFRPVLVGGRVRLGNQDRFVLTSTEVNFELVGMVVEDYGN